MDPRSSEWWRRVMDAADRALELAPEEREAFISRSLDEDPEFGVELRALFAGADVASPLDGPAERFAAPIFAELADHEANAMGDADARPNGDQPFAWKRPHGEAESNLAAQIRGLAGGAERIRVRTGEGCQRVGPDHADDCVPARHTPATGTG